MRVIYKRQLQGFCLRKQNKNKKTYLPTTETNVEQIEKNQYLSFPVLAFSTNLAHSVTIHHYVPKISPGWQKEQQLEAPFSLICETFRQLYSPSSEIIFKKKKKKATHIVETIRIFQACLFDVKGPIWGYFCSVTHADDVYSTIIDQYIS